jgi:hypothetical protein
VTQGEGDDADASAFRTWQPEEIAIARRLLERPFPGRDEALVQLEHSRVRQAPGCVGHCRTLEIEVDAGMPPINDEPGHGPLPVEAFFTDSDGIPVEIMLFETDGRLGLPEFVVFSDKQKRYPAAHELRIWDKQRGEEAPWQGEPPP